MEVLLIRGHARLGLTLRQARAGTVSRSRKQGRLALPILKWSAFLLLSARHASDLVNPAFKTIGTINLGGCF